MSRTKLNPSLVTLRVFSKRDDDVGILNRCRGGRMRRKFLIEYSCGAWDKNLSGKINDDLTRRVDFYHIIKFGINNAVNGLGESLFESYF